METAPATIATTSLATCEPVGITILNLHDCWALLRANESEGWPKIGRAHV